MKHFLDLSKFDRASKSKLLDSAGGMVKAARSGNGLGKGKILATLFYEPSTRTRLSFESAMLRLGGSWLGFADTKASSVAKGESLADTIRTVDKYADIIAIRHPAEGAALACSMYSDVPVINAGDGGHLHPSQTLLDMLTIKEELKLEQLDGLKIVLAGDLRYGRTAASLALAMADFKPHIFCATPQGLGMPPHVSRRLREELGVKVTETDSLKEVTSDADVLYVTRIQKERFFSDEEYNQVRGSYVVNAELVRDMKQDSLILHPLPRVDEISNDVDNLPQARYFEQMFYGIPARMAIIGELLGLIDSGAEDSWQEPEEHPGTLCRNPRCVTKTETYLPHLFTSITDVDNALFDDLPGEKRLRCYYCDYEVTVD